MSEKKIDGRRNNGGRREGAGRKKSKYRTPVKLNIDLSLLEQLRETPNMSDTTNEALRTYFEHE